MPMSLPTHFFDGSLPIALVAGGAGFVGSHVCEALLGRSVKVICVDNWQTGLKENINHLLLNKNFLLLEEDVTDEIATRIKKIDYVFHLAGVESYLNGEDVSIESLESNSIGSRNLLDLAQKYKAKFLLASTIYIYSAKLSKDNTTSYFGATREDEGEFSHLEAKRFAEALVSEYGQKRNVDVRIVRLGDVYGPRMMISTNNILARLVKQAAYKEPLTVHGGEDIYIHPVFIDDVVEGIVKSLFIGGTRNAIIALTGPKTSLFSVAQAIKNLKPDELEVVFKNESFPKLGQVEESVLFTGRDTISWSQEIGPEEGLRRTLDWFTYHQKYLPKSYKPVEKSKDPTKDQKMGVLTSVGEWAKKVRTSPHLVTKEESRALKEDSFWEEKEQVSPKSQKKVNAKKNWVAPKVFLAAVVLLLGWFFAMPVFLFYLGLGQLHLFKNSISKGDTTSASRWANLAFYSFDSAQAGFNQWLVVPGLKNESVRYVNKSKTFSKLADVAISSSQGALASKTFMQGLLSSQGVNEYASKSLALELKKLGQKIGFLEADIEGNKVLLTAPLLRTKLIEESELKDIRESTLTFANLVEKSGSLFGVDKKKTYLVLLQDNSILRPGGGLLRSYALLSFEGGKLENIDVQDVAFADEQLKGQVDPPQTIKDYLGETSWFLKDSNWSPDFASSAERAAWFVNKELGTNIDGVIALDLEFIKSFIDYLGPVKLDGFEAIDSNNLFELAQNSNKDQSVQKSFPTSLLREILKVATELPGSNLTALTKTTISSLRERHLALWMKDQGLAQIMSEAGWDGAAKRPSCRGDFDCTIDYLQISEANLTQLGNPLKSYSLEIFPSNDTISHRLLISYDNKNADYKGFVRVLVPRLGKIAQAAAILPDQAKQEELQVEEGFESKKKSFSFILDIKAGDKKQIVLLWDTPLSENTSKVAGDSTFKGNNLVFFWQKQMGVLNDPVSLRINLPAGTQEISSFPRPLLTSEGSISYNTNLSRDLTTQRNWQKR